MTIPLSDKFASLQPYTRKTPSLPLDAPQDTKEFTHEGVQLAYSPLTGDCYRLAHHGRNPSYRYAKWNIIKRGGIKGYTVVRINDGLQLLHVIIARHFLFADDCTHSPQIDHINHSRDDNRLANLRRVTPSQNNCNSAIQTNNTSGYKGVGLHKQSNKWRAYIKINSIGKHLGTFQTPEAAYIAYCTASREYHGEYGYYDKSQLRRAIAAECARMGGDV